MKKKVTKNSKRAKNTQKSSHHKINIVEQQKTIETSMEVHDLGEAGCIICQDCYEENNKLICERWNKIVEENDYCDSFVPRP
ncbi:MAG: hypothetical protein Q8N12_08995 [Thermodesulfovibrionales bacterium]|nr:hypothetical protein [bacterium]MDP3049542.1 hypothetical protein [Thermodesulfovibrionales bacterium]